MFCRTESGSTTCPVVTRERDIKDDSSDSFALVCGDSDDLVDVLIFTSVVLRAFTLALNCLVCRFNNTVFCYVRFSVLVDTLFMI